MIAKGTVLKNLIAAPNSLSLFGCLDVPLSDVVDQATKFYRCLLRQPSRRGDDVRYQDLHAKFENTATSAPKIQALLPTTEAFVENVKWSHL